MAMKITIIGAGVSGLSCAVVLLNAGFEVVVVSDKWSPHTTSDTAAAIWYPFTVNPPNRVNKWGAKTFEVFTKIYEEEKDSGIIMVDGYDLYGEEEPEPLWKNIVKNYKRIPPTELPTGYKDGFFFSTFVIDMSYYMIWLSKLFISLGGKKEVKSITKWEDILDTDIIVNCSGLGSIKLFQDKEMYPIRGQILKVDQPKVEHFYLDFHNGPNKLGYIIPRIDNCVLGGTAEVNDWDQQIKSAATDTIIDRCSSIVPKLSNANIVSSHVGLRPGRSEVRLEKDVSFSKPIIHNYGHGGAGVTISWGCAEEVLSLVKDCDD